MGAQRITQAQKDHYFTLRTQGWSIVRACSEAGFSIASAKGFEKKRGNGASFRAEKHAEVPDIPVDLDYVCDEAKDALADRTGALFCKRYLGLTLVPWQQELWTVMEDGWDGVDREFLCVNAAPGAGKSFVGVAFAAKRVVLDRSIRILFISRAHSLAERNARRLRRLLERTAPPVDAQSTLSKDFGRFKPRYGGDVWKASEFVVEQMDGSPIDEKEPTCSAFGFDSEWLGNRLDFVFGDDLDSTRSIRNMEIVEGNREIFDNELEARLEPGGLFVIAQQRLGAFDFSNHVLAKITPPDDDDGETDGLGVAQYKHVIFKAHYEDRCIPEYHRPGAPAYPYGCLLQPDRLGYRDIRKAMNNPTRYKVVYQQEDVSAEEALVQRIWVDGGRGTDGVTYLGCWDKDRGAWELPPNLVGGNLGIITVDPSPTRYWSVQAWCVNPDTEQRFLLDLHRERMEAPDFLDWSTTLNSFTGLAEDWWHLFQRVGVKLSHVIVERNAAQRFMLQYEFFHRWQKLRGLNVISHDTNRNKADPDYGIQMLANVWKHGQVRLPGRQLNTGRIASMRLVDEVTRWPNTSTDDCVMGQWFLEHNLPALRPSLKALPRVTHSPSWIDAA